MFNFLKLFSSFSYWVSVSVKIKSLVKMLLFFFHFWDNLCICKTELLIFCDASFYFLFVIKFSSFLFASIGFTTNICIVNIREGNKVKKQWSNPTPLPPITPIKIAKSLSGQTLSLTKAWNFNFLRFVLFFTLCPSLSHVFYLWNFKYS